MASGFTAAQTGRTHDRTRPMLQQRQKVLAKAPSTHDPKRRSSRKVTAKIDKGACQLFICRNRFDADQFVAGSKRNGPSAHLQCFQNRKNGSLTLLKKHRSGHRLRLVYTMADGGWRMAGGFMSSAHRTAAVREDAIIAFLLFCLEIFQAEQQRKRKLH
jgi:hypothetical protein